jgi:hypothetical protein
MRCAIAVAAFSLKRSTSSNQVLEILSRNRERLLDFMTKFHQDNDNEQVRP